jgi:DNA-binding NtrC family response regulator
MISDRDKFLNFIDINFNIDFFFLDELSLSFDLLKLIVFNFPQSKIVLLMKGKSERFKEAGNLIFYSKPLSIETMTTILFKDKVQIQSSLDQKPNNLLVGSSKVMDNLRKELLLLSKEDCPVLLFGESGTGKELAAKTIHLNSKYHFNESVSINCSLLNTDLSDSILFGHKKGSFTGAEEETVGLIEKANNNTFFLDEIENISLNSQGKLLRAIEFGEYRKIGDNNVSKSNFRLISASNKDLDSLVSQKIFRDDFYFRISLIQVRLPPLNEHKSDIEELVFHYFKTKGEKRSFEKDFISKLKDLDFPGNIRQLNSILEKSRIYSTDKIIRLKI